MLYRTLLLGKRYYFSEEGRYKLAIPRLRVSDTYQPKREQYMKKEKESHLYTNILSK